MLAWLIAVFVPALSGGKAMTTLLLQLTTGRIRTMSKSVTPEALVCACKYSVGPEADSYWHIHVSQNMIQLPHCLFRHGSYLPETPSTISQRHCVPVLCVINRTDYVDHFCLLKKTHRTS
jgi:hypothetical protein